MDDARLINEPIAETDLKTRPLLMSDSSSENATGSDSPPVERSAWQFSLRTLFIALTIAAIAVGWFLNGPERQRRAAEGVREAGGVVQYEGSPPSESPRGWIPLDYYRSAVAVRLERCQEADRALAHVGDLFSVKQVDIQHCQVTKEGIAQLSTMRSLTTLSLAGSNIDDECLTTLQNCRGLESLALTETSATSQGVGNFADLPNLYDLRIFNPQRPLVDLHTLPRLPRLRELLLANQGGETKFDAASVSDCKELTKVALWNVSIDDTGLEQLAKLPRLENLAIITGRVSDRGMIAIGKMANLESLTLKWLSVRPESLVHLAGLKKLRYLTLGTTPVRDADVSHLQRLPALEVLRLNLSGSSLTDEGLDELLKIPTLRTLDIANSGISKDKLQRASKILDARPAVPAP